MPNTSGLFRMYDSKLRCTHRAVCNLDAVCNSDARIEQYVTIKIKY